MVRYSQEARRKELRRNPMNLLARANAGGYAKAIRDAKKKKEQDNTNTTITRVDLLNNNKDFKQDQTNTKERLAKELEQLKDNKEDNKENNTSKNNKSNRVNAKFKAYEKGGQNYLAIDRQEKSKDQIDSDKKKSKKSLLDRAKTSYDNLSDNQKLAAQIGGTLLSFTAIGGVKKVYQGGKWLLRTRVGDKVKTKIVTQGSKLFNVITKASRKVKGKFNRAFETVRDKEGKKIKRDASSMSNNKKPEFKDSNPSGKLDRTLFDKNRKRTNINTKSNKTESKKETPRQKEFKKTGGFKEKKTTAEKRLKKAVDMFKKGELVVRRKVGETVEKVGKKIQPRKIPTGARTQKIPRTKAQQKKINEKIKQDKFDEKQNPKSEQDKVYDTAVKQKRTNAEFKQLIDKRFREKIDAKKGVGGRKIKFTNLDRLRANTLKKAVEKKYNTNLSENAVRKLLEDYVKDLNKLIKKYN